MKKILILAYDFPPYNSIGGQRPYAWFKYLNEFGYEPIVVTRHWDNPVSNPIDYIQPTQSKTVLKEMLDNGTIYRVPFFPNKRDELLIKHGLNKFKFLRKVLSFYYLIFEFVSFKFDNKRELFIEAQKVLKEHKITAIIATGEPFILFRYASLLSKNNNVPWIADYRDGWSTNYTRSKWGKLFYSEIEKNIVSSATIVTAASAEFAEQLKKLLNKNVSVLLNGYFEEKFNSLELSNKPNKFIISFAGTLYPYQPIELFAKGFSVFSSGEKKDVVLRFIGLKFYEEQVLRIKKAFESISADVEFTDRLPHEKTIELLNQSSVLLLPASPQYPQIYAKVFDYLALHKNIILCKSDEGSLEKIISETNSGCICNTAEEVAIALKKMYIEWREKGYVTCNSTGIEKYSRRNQTKKLAEVLDGV